MVFVVVIEGVLLFYVQRGQDVPAFWGGLTQLAVVYSLVGIAVLIVAWAFNRRPPDAPPAPVGRQSSPPPNRGKKRR